MKRYTLLLPLIAAFAVTSCASHHAHHDMKAMHKQCMDEGKKGELMCADKHDKGMKDCCCMDKDKHGEMNMKGKSCMVDKKKDMGKSDDASQPTLVK